MERTRSHTLVQHGVMATQSDRTSGVFLSRSVNCSGWPGCEVLCCCCRASHVEKKIRNSMKRLGKLKTFVQQRRNFWYQFFPRTSEHSFRKISKILEKFNGNAQLPINVNRSDRLSLLPGWMLSPVASEWYNVLVYKYVILDIIMICSTLWRN